MKANLNRRQWSNCAFPHDAVAGVHNKLICVGRSDEIGICVDALVERTHNVLLYGDRGVGKSFFVRRMLVDELRRSDPSALVISLRVTDLAAYSPTDLSAAFTRAILMALCTHIWTELIGKSYIDLRESLGHSGKELSASPTHEKLVQRIYRQLMISESSARFERSSSIGLSAGIVGNTDERRERSVKQSDLLPFEFFEFLAELKESVLTKFKKKRVVVLCDEANVLTHGQQIDLLERHLQLFADGRVQFLFVVGLVPNDRKLNLPESFESRLHLEGLPASEISSLLQRIEVAPSVSFPQPAVNKMCEALRRNTRLVLQAAEEVEKLCIQNGNSEVTIEVAAAVANGIIRRVELFEKQFGKQPRKRN